MTTQTWIFFILGFVGLLVGAEFLVRGASQLAARLGISPLVIGLTVVAFGTSSPELAVSVQGAWSGAAAVSLGNVLGSNVFNILLVLGLSAVVAPLVVAHQLVRIEVPLMIASTAGVAFLVRDGVLDRTDGLLLFTTVVVYTTYAIRSSRAESRNAEASAGDEMPTAEGGTGASLGMQLLMLVGGLIMLMVGSDWLVEGAVAIATSVGLSERVIALTLVAAGTSLPEVATSVMASVRGEREIAVGNAIGSNLFNLLTVLGFAALVAPNGIEAGAGVLDFDLPIAFAVAVICWPIFVRSFIISRADGVLLCGLYVLYVVYLVATTSGAAWEGLLADAMIWGIGPLIALVLSGLAFRGIRARRSAS